MQILEIQNQMALNVNCILIIMNNRKMKLITAEIEIKIQKTAG